MMRSRRIAALGPDTGGTPAGDGDPAEPVRQRDHTGAVVAAIIAAVLGVGHALFSAYWAVGGTALLDTVGGVFERWGRQRGAGVVGGLWAIAAVKAAVALGALVLVGIGAGSLPAWTRGRATRAFGWIAAGTLVVYGGLLTLTGLIGLSGIVDQAEGTNHRHLVWHAFFWDPWFLLWGLAFAASLWFTRLVDGPRCTTLARTRVDRGHHER